MKLNISNPATGCQKMIEVDDEKQLRAFYDKRISQEVEGEALGDDYAGYIFRVSGGNDKQGFPMKQGVLTNHRVRLLLSKGLSCYRPRKTGERKRKSVRGCIVGPDLAVLNLVIVKKGETDLPGLTDQTLPLRLGPKRASRIRKLRGLGPREDVRKFVVRRTVREGSNKSKSKAPKIQRLVTPRRLQHKRQAKAEKKAHLQAAKTAAADYKKLLKQKRAAQIAAARAEKK